MSSLKEKTAKGLFWGAVNSGSTQLLNVVIGVCLARLLDLSDYGIVGMLTIFTAIAGNLQDSGFSTALINLPKIRHRDYNAVFWFGVSVSTILYVILFFCAPLIADFFHQPSLIPLSRFVFLSFVLASLGIPHSAYMIRNFMNKEKALMGFVALLVSGGVGILLAFRGYGYWSLAWQQLLFILVLDIGRLYYTRWLPTFEFDFAPIRSMFGFSNKILITTVISTISNNFLTFIFGHLFTSKTVGSFTQAYKWDMMGYSLISNTVAQVAQPVFAQVGGDNARLKGVFRKMVRFTAFLSFPLMFGLCIVSKEFIVVAIGAKWMASVPLLQILCVSGAFFPFYTLYQNLAISHSRSDILMWCNVGQIALQLVLVFISAPYGIQTMVVVYSLFNIVWLGVWQYVAKRLVGITLLDMFRDVVPFLLASLAIMGLTYVVTLPIHSLLPLLIVRILLAAGLYFAVMKVAHVAILEESLAYLGFKAKQK
uniref:Lipopolysaccharide biosynthesis protein n=1 Tax=Prevotella sp. GTC17254 TaxID=3236794 RepID=A0AB33J5A7_9BACT